MTPYVNLLDPEFYVDPFDAYRWLRDESPVHWDPVQQLWGISRHADVQAVENDDARYRSLDGSRPHTDQRDDSSMINSDDPDHQRQRMVVARRFTPSGVRSHEDRVRARVTELLDEVLAEGECEAVEAIASCLPAMMICELIGYPMELWPSVRRWSEVTMFEAGQTPADGSPQDQSGPSMEAVLEFAAETTQVLEQRRRDPQDDLISVWAHTEVDGEPWTDKQVLEEALLVLDGGAETTRAVIGAILLELARGTRTAAPEARRGPVAARGPGRGGVHPLRVAHLQHKRHRPSSTTSCTTSSSRRATRCCCCTGRPTATTGSSPTPRTSTSAGPATTTWCSGSAPTSASAPRWPAWSCGCSSTSWSGGRPSWEVVGPEPKIVPATFTRGYDQVHVLLLPRRLTRPRSSHSPHRQRTGRAPADPPRRDATGWRVVAC